MKWVCEYVEAQNLCVPHYSILVVLISPMFQLKHVKTRSPLVPSDIPITIPRTNIHLDPENPVILAESILLRGMVCVDNPLQDQRLVRSHIGENL